LWFELAIVTSQTLKYDVITYTPKAQPRGAEGANPPP